MELMVRDGDYVPDEGGGYRRAEGSQELLQRVLWKLSIPRGSFPFLPNLAASSTSWVAVSPPSGRIWPSSMWPRPWRTSLT